MGIKKLSIIGLIIGSVTVLGGLGAVVSNFQASGLSQQEVKGTSTVVGNFTPLATPSVLPTIKPLLTPISTPTPIPTIKPTANPPHTPIVAPSPLPSSDSLSNNNYYTNTQGDSVHAPAYSEDYTVPNGATAKCNDGTYSFSENHRGTCSHHGGVEEWYQ